MTFQRSYFNIAFAAGLLQDMSTVKSWLASTLTEWLLIIDNYDDKSKDLIEYIPVDGKGAIVFTSRKKHAELRLLTVIFTFIETRTMKSADAEFLLLNMTEGDDGNSPVTPDFAKSITQLLGRLPLAIIQAASFVRKTKCTGQEFLDRYNGVIKNISVKDSVETASTLALNIEELEKQGDRASLDAIDFLRFCSFVASKFNPEELLGKAWKYDLQHPKSSDSGVAQLRLLRNGQRSTWHPSRLSKTLGVLESFSLITVGFGGATISMQQLIRDIIKHGLSAADSAWYSTIAASTLAAAASFDVATETFASRDALVSHLNIFLQHDNDNLITESSFGAWTDTLSLSARASQDVGRVDQALELETRAFKLRTKFIGQEHPSTLRSMHRMCRSLRNLGRLSEAIDLEEQALRLWQSHHADLTHEILESMTSLAHSYSMQNFTEKAAALLQQALALRQKLPDESQGGTINTMSQLASAYHDLSFYNEALKLEKIALSMQRLSDDDHPDIVAPINNLAVTHGKLGHE